MTTGLAMSAFADTIYRQKYAQEGEEWLDTARRVVENVMKPYFPDLVDEMVGYVAERKVLPGGRYLYAAGKKFNQVNNCLLLSVEDSREDWADLMRRITSALMTGAGVGVVYSALRPNGAPVRGMGGKSTGPLALMQMVNEAGRHIMQGGARRAAVWAGLHWDHPDIFSFITMKDWSEQVRALKEADFNFPACMDGTNISVILDDEFFAAYGDPGHIMHVWAHKVYWGTVAQMLTTAEPGFSIDVGVNAGEHLRNACCEITSRDDSDICNLSSINLAQVSSRQEMARITYVATRFLLCGTLYSKVPYLEVATTRDKNRRLGLGLMGIYEWLAVRGKPYGPDEELATWLEEYAKSGEYANVAADELGISRPVKTRAIAPTGCQRADSMILTSEGLLELGELGDEKGPRWQSLDIRVAQECGEAQAADKFFVNGWADTKIVKLSSGLELEATPNHRYRVLADGKYLWRGAGDLHPGDLLVVALGGYDKSTEPELTYVRPYYHTEREVRLPQHMNPELAWFLGVLAADGSTHSKGIRIACNAHEDDYKRVAIAVESLFGVSPTLEDNGRNCLSVCISSSRILRWLYVNGLDKRYSKDVEVPYLVRTASRESLCAYVDGLWFGDGSQSNSARYIDTSSKRLGQQLVTIYRALGHDVAMTHKSQSEDDGRWGTYTMYRVRIVKTFRKCATKQVRQQLHDLGLLNCTVDEVLSTQDSQCLTLDLSVPETMTYVANGVVSHNTIAILAETTSGIEPLFASAYKRRFLKEKTWHFQYVVDATAKRLIDKGVDPASLEDAYDLAADPERRVAFQAWLQQWVDHGISSTINLPSRSEQAFTLTEFGEMLMRYLPRLRGVTVYPDGSRGGQPITKVPLGEALDWEGYTYEEVGNEKACVSGVCGT